MFNSHKRNLNVFHCYKKSESPKDSLFYSHPLPSLPPLPPLPPLPLLPVPLTAPIPPTAPTTPIPARAARTPSLPVRLAPPPSFSESLQVFHQKIFLSFSTNYKKLSKKVAKKFASLKKRRTFAPANETIRHL